MDNKKLRDKVQALEGELAELKIKLKVERDKVIRQIETIGYNCPYGYNYICLHREEFDTMIREVNK